MNIEEYEWFDSSVETKCVTDLAVCIGTNKVPWIGIAKDDVIALARHFKLTSKDIGDV